MIIGTFAVLAAAGVTLSVGVPAASALLPQHIVFTSTPPANPTVGDTYKVAAHADPSMLPATISSGSPAVCSVGSDTVTFVHAGTCIVNADRAADVIYDKAPTAHQTISVAKAPQSIAFTRVTADKPVPGQVFSVSTSQGASGNPVSIGTSTPSICSTRGVVVTARHHGTCVLTADQPGNADYEAGHATRSVSIYKAYSGTSLTIRPTELVAQVVPIDPALGHPTGRVGFSVDGHYAGEATLAKGFAYLQHVVPAGSKHTVHAVYRGSNDFRGSSDTLDRTDPRLTAKVTSKHARTKYGWYNEPVTVTFHCTVTDAPVRCPKPYTFSANTYRGSVTRTITAADGGKATVTVRNINIDRTAPTATLRSGKAVCHDKYSGIARCYVTHFRSHGHSYVRATAIDRAGNRDTYTRRG